MFNPCSTHTRTHTHTHTQAQFAEQSVEGTEKIIATTQSALQGDSQPGDNEKPHTLEQFSIDHFLPLKKTLSRTLSRAGFRKGKESEIWSFSRVRVPSVILSQKCPGSVTS